MLCKSGRDEAKFGGRLAKFSGIVGKSVKKFRM